MIHNISRFIAALALLATAQGAWAWDGSGTAESPYQIKSTADLDQLATDVNSGTEHEGDYFVLTTDLTYSHETDWNDAISTENNFKPIGGYNNNFRYFKGHFDGQSHTISGIRIYQSGSETEKRYAALFGFIDGAEVKNVFLADARFTGYYYCGPIVGFNSGSVSNCHVLSDVTIHAVTASADYHGGIAGINTSRGTITGCTSAATISGDVSCEEHGGIVGSNSGTVEDCIYFGNTVEATKKVGAICGDVVSNGTVRNCYYTDATFTGKNSSGTALTNDASAIGYKTSGVTIDDARLATSDDFAVSGDTYTIGTAAGWSVMCAALYHNDTYNRFSGKTVNLGDDITVSRMAGSDGHEFMGNFNGQGNTLTVNYANTDNNVRTAPFSYVDGATIRNLIVDGTISGSAYRAAGVIGETGTNKSYITNCVSSLTISSGRYTAGFSIGGNVEIEGCVFNGKIVGTQYSGGFIGYSKSAQVIKNSLFAPKDGSSISGGTFYYNGDGDVAPVNSYYTRALGTAQGKALHSVTAGDDVTLALSGTATEYTVSGITAYEGNQGIKYGTTYYAGSGDAVSLTLSNTAPDAPDGYQYDGYTVSAGTLSGSANPYTLTMPDEDVTVRLALTWTGDGTEDNPYIIYNKDQLDLLAHRVNGTHGETRQTNGFYNTYFQLNNDITYDYTGLGDSESNYEAIGGYYGGNRSFRGHFDGNNKTISGIRIYKGGKSDADKYQGIFGRTDSGADIHHLTLADARITGYDYTGGIVGYINGGTVTRCHVAADVAVYAVQYDAYYHGGIAGNNWGAIEQCTSAATLTTADANRAMYYGGIAGYNLGTLRDNLAIGATVPAAKNNSYGAITGYNNNGGTLQRNYYAACNVADVENATGVGCGYIDDGNGGRIVADVNNVNNPDGAVSINTLDLAARQAPDGNYWTTYYNGTTGFTIDKNENACAYTATYGAGQLTLHKLGKQIPAETAVIIVAENNVVSMTAATALDDFSGTNDLHGEDYDTPVADIRNDLGTGTFYVLGMTTVDNEQHFGFHRYAGEKMAAHKAFVLVSGSQALARSLTMVFDEATGIESLTPDAAPKAQAADHWFTLDGRRLQAKPTVPGIYVNNGKKVVIK